MLGIYGDNGKENGNCRDYRVILSASPAACCWQVFVPLETSVMLDEIQLDEGLAMLIRV